MRPAINLILLISRRREEGNDKHSDLLSERLSIKTSGFFTSSGARRGEAGRPGDARAVGGRKEIFIINRKTRNIFISLARPARKKTTPTSNNSKRRRRLNCAVVKATLASPVSLSFTRQSRSHSQKNPIQTKKKKFQMEMKRFTSSRPPLPLFHRDGQDFIFIYFLFHLQRYARVVTGVFVDFLLCEDWGAKSFYFVFIAQRPVVKLTDKKFLLHNKAKGIEFCGRSKE